MSQKQPDQTNSSEKLDQLLKKVAVLEGMMLMGNKVYMKQKKEKVPSAMLQGKVETTKPEVLASEIFTMEIELVNYGSSSVALDGIEEILPCCGLELMTKPEEHDLEDSYLDLNGKVLEPSKKEKMRFSIRALEKGTYTITPRIVYVAGKGGHKIQDLKPVTIEVNEILLPDRLGTGFKELDNLLFGGIPLKYAVALKSISCDETKLLINRFIEKGVKNSETTFLVTAEIGRWESLAKEFTNFNLFICNPQTESINESLSNVSRIRGVENLTDVNIPLVSALRKLNESDEKPRRICIEILSDILLQHKAVQTRRWLTGLITELKMKGFTTLAVINPHMYPSEEVQAVLDLFSGEIEVYEKDNQKLLRIRKMYEQDYLVNELPLKKNVLSTTGIARRLKYCNY